MFEKVGESKWFGSHVPTKKLAGVTPEVILWKPSEVDIKATITALKPRSDIIRISKPVALPKRTDVLQFFLKSSFVWKS